MTADLGQRSLTGTQIVHGVVSPLPECRLARVWPTMTADGVRAWTGDLLDGHDRLLTVSFGTAAMRVCAGVGRRADQPAFEPGDLERLETVISLVSRHAALHVQCSEYLRRDLVLRALRKVSDAGCVVDLVARRVVWLFDFARDRPCARALLASEHSVVELVAGEHAAGNIERLVGRPAAAAVITGVADLGCVPEFGHSPCVALALDKFDEVKVPLSTREREVARLLIEGYSVVNAAAILSISENSIRTYVRRLYRKLDVTNRADLTRKCLALYAC
ncbi:MAG TPA: helix-turn-helix transcriptional regulator [Kofleriaceae bacterium]|nr:helix-turn-helix transcriptional regulator [Kofleriaceae bacterium]